MSERKTKTIVERIAPSFAIIGLLATTGYFIYTNFINIPKSNLEFNLITKTPLIDIKENISMLNVEYDSINLNKDKKNISIVILEIKNNGNKSITSNDYDANISFGIKVLNSEIIKTPSLIKSSDENYFKDIYLANNKTEIILDKKIIDKDEFFQLKFYLIHEKDIDPEISFLGKISGQKQIQINNLEEINESEYEDYMQISRLITILSTSLITILSLLTLSLYKNNNIRLKTSNMLYRKNEELLTKYELLEQKLSKKHKKNKK